jgi:hypothetical protein
VSGVVGSRKCDGRENKELASEKLSFPPFLRTMHLKTSIKEIKKKPTDKQRTEISLSRCRIPSKLSGAIIYIKVKCLNHSLYHQGQVKNAHFYSFTTLLYRKSCLRNLRK